MVNKRQGQLKTSNTATELEDTAILAWNQINWSKVERYVFKLQTRIYQASKCDDIRKVRMLQKTLLRSTANKLLSVRRVTQDNQGKKTAGVDGVKSLTPKQRIELVKTLRVKGKADPTRRVWIPKPNGEQRPLGIPVMYDRAVQNIVKNIIEPEWEARFEGNSYGFRAGRSCHDAISQIKKCIQHKAKYVLDADIAKCFDRINHEKLLDKLGYSGIIRRQLKSWLNSGVIDEGVFTKTDKGTPQGGVISPLLANVALHGMEIMLKDLAESIPIKGRSKTTRRRMMNFIRYADDFVIMHQSKEIILKCQEVISTWLNEIGLELKPEKTRLTHTLDPKLSEDGKAGFDFLGFHIQQYPAGNHRSSKNLRRQLTGFVTLITPTKKKCKEHQLKIGEIIRKSKKAPQENLISQLNPVIRGWANYYKYSDIKTVGESGQQDYLTYLKLRRWAKRRCKSTSDGYKKYWHQRDYIKLDGKKSTRVEFATDKRGGYSLFNHIDVECSSIKYVKVKGDKSVSDGDIIYWSKRKGEHPELSTRVATLLKKQKGKCNICHSHFINDEVMEVDHITPKAIGGKDTYSNLQLLHGHCHDNKTKQDLIEIRKKVLEKACMI